MRSSLPPWRDRDDEKREICGYGGFTLIEVILYVGIIGIVFGAVVPFAWSMIGNGAKSAVQQEVTGNVRFVSEKIKREVRNASGISAVSANSITLTNFAPDSTTAIDLSGGRVRVNKNGGGAVDLSSDGVVVTDLTFTDNTSGDQKTKNISFTLTVEAQGVRQEYEATALLRSSAELRSN